MKIIPIFFTFDDNFTIPAAVAFNSLLKKAPENVFYKLYVLNNGLLAENENILFEIVSKFKNASLEFRNTNGFLIDAWGKGSFYGHQSKNQFTMETLYRCYAATFFPEYDKIIYSDVDIVVMDDISELFDMDLKDTYIGAVKGVFNKQLKDIQFGYMKPEHYNKFKDTYFGGGIWVLNLNKIREDNLEKTMSDIIYDNSIEKAYLDQDVMNIACDNNVTFISLRYISYPYIESYIKSLEGKFISDYNPFEIWESIYYPKILHYAAGKPWNRQSERADIWFNELDSLPIQNKYDWVNSLRKKRKRIKRLKKLVKLCPIKNLREKLIKRIENA